MVSINHMEDRAHECYHFQKRHERSNRVYHLRNTRDWVTTSVARLKGNESRKVLSDPILPFARVPAYLLPYQCATVIGIQSVFGSLASTQRLGKRSPLSRGRPIRPGYRGGAGS